MKALSAGLVVILFLVLPAAAEEKPLNLEFSGTTLAEAAKVISLLAGVEVSVEKELEAVPVTLSMKEAGIEDCLGFLAKLAGPDVEWRKEAEGKYVIARKVPEWKAALLAKLGEVSMDLAFEETPLEEVARFLGEFCGAGVVVDPAWLEETEPDERNLTLASKEIALEDALGLLAALKGLAWDLRWGVVFIGKAERLKELPAMLLPAPVAEVPGDEAGLRKTLSGPISLSFEGATISDCLETVRRLAKVEIVLPDQASLGYARATPISVSLSEVTVEQALAVLLLPHGFRGSVKDGKLVLTRR